MFFASFTWISGLFVTLVNIFVNFVMVDTNYVMWYCIGDKMIQNKSKRNYDSYER